jgi:hypothetical protein
MAGLLIMVTIQRKELQMEKIELKHAKSYWVKMSFRKAYPGESDVYLVHPEGCVSFVLNKEGMEKFDIRPAFDNTPYGMVDELNYMTKRTLELQRELSHKGLLQWRYDDTEEWICEEPKESFGHYRLKLKDKKEDIIVCHCGCKRMELVTSGHGDRAEFSLWRCSMCGAAFVRDHAIQR